MSVKDIGHGRDQSTMDHIFDSCFSTEKPDEDSGPALAVVHDIITSHGGKIEVAIEPDI
jgi:sensor histidine kinase regulating citrate/malate metabolism